MRALLQLVGIGVLASVLVGCGSGMRDLEQRVADVKSRPSEPIEPIPQVKPYEAFTYDSEGRRDPFQKAEGAVAAAASGPRPDLNRSREPLEEFPLDALRMRGVIQTSNAVFALIKSPDGVIHRVSIGNHAGQNYGQITSISEAEVTLAEIVPDGFGGWVSRPATLALAQ